MAIKYKTRLEEITKVEISRESEFSIWDMENRRHNKSGWETYHNTFAEAKESLRQKQLKEIETLKNFIKYYEDKLEKIEAIEEF